MSAPMQGSSPIQNAPFLPTAVYPSLPLVGLSEDEATVANVLAQRLFQARPSLELSGLYYDSEQKMQDLGISIPPSLSGLREAMGWPQIGVDAVDERLGVQGFRYADGTDADEDLLDIWLANNMGLESSLAHLDALIYGRCYVIVGSADDLDEPPLITCESPLNMMAVYDARLRKVTSALQIYLNTDWSSDMYGREVAALYLPGRTIHMTREASANAFAGKWEIVTRDQHGMEPPVVRLGNRQRTSSRDGASEITPAWRNTTDRGCRNLLGMEVGREFHATPRRYVLGASEENFQRPDGTPVSAWETYVNKVWAIERDENGDVPTVGQFPASDPSTYTKLFDVDRQVMASTMGVPPHYLGITSDGNPASADAIRQMEARLIKRVERKQLAFGEAWQQAMRFALMIRDGAMPSNAHRIETEWEDAGTPTPGATTDALQKQVASGMVPPTSDVVLKRAGYSAQERMRLEVDRKVDAGASLLAELATSLQAKEARVDTSIARAINPAAVKAAPVVNPATGNVEPPAAPTT